MKFFSFILGSVMGSFLNLQIMRKTSRPITEPFSVCDHCHKRLHFYNLIPILSFLFQRGRSNCCHKKLSIGYPISEVLSGFLFVMVYFLVGDFYKSILMAVLISLLIAMSIIDLKTKDIYYSHIAGVFFLSAILSYYNFWFKEEVIYKIIFSTLLLIIGYMLSRKDYVGFGDILLILCLNLSLNFHETTIFLFFISIVGGLAALVLYLKKRDRKMKIAFVPIIASSFILLEIVKGMIA
ncbi:prepilin peptidase [Lagierella sp. ICN-221743]